MLNDVILLVCFASIGSVNLKNAIERDDTPKGMRILALLVAILCCMAGYRHAARIVDYGRSPKVMTTEAPAVDTLKTDSGTYYLYEFKDNHYQELRKGKE